MLIVGAGRRLIGAARASGLLTDPAGRLTDPTGPLTDPTGRLTDPTARLTGTASTAPLLAGARRATGRLASPGLSDRACGRVGIDEPVAGAPGAA